MCPPTHALDDKLLFHELIADGPVVQNEICLVIEKAFPRSGDRLEVEVESRAGAALEESAQQCETFGKRTEIADHNRQLALLAHRELRRVRLEHAQFMQEDPRALAKRSPGFRQADAIAAGIEQGQAELLLEIFHGQGHGWLRPEAFACSGLKAASVTTASKP